jgi:TRAP-type mannitol/chloroaromatic compound transport system permease large subunit
VGLVLPFSLTLAFLATPCAVLFYLEVIAHRPVTLVQGIVGIVLYSLSAIALFMASLALSRTE